MNAPETVVRSRRPGIVRMVLAGLALAAGLAPWWSAREEGWRAFPGFDVAPAVEDVVDELPIFETIEINPGSPEAKAHSATLARMPDGRLVAAWYAGSGEGHTDVGIFTSVRDPRGAWSEPRRILSREMMFGSLGRYALSLGNPLLLPGEGGKLGLLFVSIAAGRWSGSSLNLAWSEDGGETWGPVEKLTTNPLFNLAALPRNPPARLDGGGWAVPVYEELVGNFPEILWLLPRNGGFSAAVSRMAGGLEVMQPALVPLSVQDAAAFYRDVTKTRRMFMARSEDSGRAWSRPEPTELPNFHSGVCVVRLPDGRLLCAFNDTTKRVRENLRLAISGDEGRTWRRIATLAEEKEQEFSYPYMLVGDDGWVRMVYSSRKNRICYVEFNSEWLNSMADAAQRKGEVP
ncbi:MAG: exo-alpha-sialidase [Chthoniobacterales bacterium]|nr:exo-alpha-sialidase [Chthoniobacterales bacterium]